VFSSPAITADLQTKSPPAPAQFLESSPLEIEVGSRYWLSNGGYLKNLYDNVIPNQMNSRLSYSSTTGRSAEAFRRVDHETDVFAKMFSW